MIIVEIRTEKSLGSCYIPEEYHVRISCVDLRRKARVKVKPTGAPNLEIEGESRGKEQTFASLVKL